MKRYPILKKDEYLDSNTSAVIGGFKNEKSRSAKLVGAVDFKYFTRLKEASDCDSNQIQILSNAVSSLFEVLKSTQS